MLGNSADNRVKAQSELAKLRAVLLKDTDEMKANLLAVANASLKMYFGMKEMHQALKVVEQTDNYLPETIIVQKSDQVTFNYYVGRLYIYFHKFDKTGGPVYCLAYNFRRQQIMAGQNKKVRLFQLIGEDTHTTTDVLEKKSVSCSEHYDIVSCIVSCEGRFYSAGYDRKIVIYDVPHHGDLKLRVTNSIKEAHDASISCMIYGKDADNSWYYHFNIRLITGSIDRVVKLWSLDGNLMQRVDGFNDTITSICYVIPTQTLWVTANSPAPVVYDPRSGINVSDFVQTDDERFHLRGGSIGFRTMIFVPETNEVIAVSNRRSVVVWRYNSVAPLTVLPGHSDIVECLAFNSKEPILIFSGGDDGIIRKWERLQLITFMYSQESYVLPKEEFKDKEDVKAKEEEGKKSKLLKHPTLKYLKQRKAVARKGMNDLPILPPITKHKAVRPGVVSMTYYEELDYLISGYEDSKIRIWGYNEETILYQDPRVSMDNDLIDPKNLQDEAVTSRVAGMTLKETLSEHKDSVTALVCVKRDNNHWLLSTGWDRRIILWNLSTLRMQDIFKNNSMLQPKEELAADGIILGMDYSYERNEFAYCSSDKLAYIRKFSANGSEMKLMAVLQGHEAEVTQIKWNKHASQWITGSEDRTVRIWPAEGIPCIRVINNDGPVTALCIDSINGCLVTGSQDKIIRVFDMEKKDEIVQKNMGHTDEIRSLIHIPSRNQYVSASWDNTVRIWNAYLKKGQRKMAKTTMKFQVEEEEVRLTNQKQPMSYSELNPLIVPKLLSKPLFVKEFVLEKPPAKDEDIEENLEKSALEEELRQTLNDLDIALNSTEKQNRGGKRALKVNKKKVG
ncbi:hypothetical protein HDV04_000854 [Boothiomyces sp. JEL0838]|nr:hypothetical protein HDV04_000854 [Boothiomyces sp. JEL0838]